MKNQYYYKTMSKSEDIHTKEDTKLDEYIMYISVAVGIIALITSFF